MTPVEPGAVHPGARLVTFGAGQPQYDPLPAAVDAAGVVLTEWEPTADELDRILSGGRVRLWVHTFGAPIQPVCLEVTAPPGGLTERPCRE